MITLLLGMVVVENRWCRVFSTVYVLRDGWMNEKQAGQYILYPGLRIKITCLFRARLIGVLRTIVVYKHLMNNTPQIHIDNRFWQTFRHLKRKSRSLSSKL